MMIEVAGYACDYPSVVVCGSSYWLPPSPPHLRRRVLAQLPLLPEPLALKKGSLLVDIEIWSDGRVLASLPGIGLRAEGESDFEAIWNLADEVRRFLASAKITMGDREGMPDARLLQRWKRLAELVDTSRMD
jgi:hypothetical protein